MTQPFRFDRLDRSDCRPGQPHRTSGIRHRVGTASGVRTFALAVLTCCLVAAGSPAVQAQDNAPTTDSSKKPSLEIKADDSPEAVRKSVSPEETMANIPEEIVAKGRIAKDEFLKVRKKLNKSIVEMRSTHIHYMNEEDQSPEAEERYWEQRNRTRELLRELFDRSVDVLLLVPDHESAEFIVTMLKHREKYDIYDYSTMQGGTLLIEAGMTYSYVIRATARSSVAVGKFQIAKSLYEAVDDKHLEDIDRAIIANGVMLEQQWNRQVKLREQDKEKGPLPQVKIKTSRGDVLVELYIHQAPSTVANFIKLCDDGFYDGLNFHQVVDSLLALTGDDSGRGTGNTGKFLADECGREDARQPVVGSLVMAKQPIPDSQRFIPNSSSCQFAILYVPLPQILGQQTVFGRVIEGMDVVCSLRRVDPSKEKKKGTVLLPPDRIISTEVVRRPEKMPEIKYFDLESALKDPHYGHDHGPGEHHHHDTHAPAPPPL